MYLNKTARLTTGSLLRNTFLGALLAAMTTTAYAGAPVYLGGNIDVGADWSTTSVPTSSDAATFTTVGGTGNLTSTVSFGEIVVSGAPALTLGNGGGTFGITLGNSTGGTGIDMSAATAGVTISAPITLAFSQLWNVASGQTLTVTGAIAGTGLSITANGLGTIALNAANTFTGGVMINSGTVSFNNANSFDGASGSITLNGGTLTNALGATNFATPITVTAASSGTITESGSTSFTGAITIGNGATLNLSIPSGGTFTMTSTGTIAGAGTVELNGSLGVLRFNGSNTGSTATTFDLGTTGNATLQTRGVTGGQTVALGALEGGSVSHLVGAGSTATLTTYDIGSNNLSTTFAGNISEHATNEEVSIVKVGTGTLTLSNTTSSFASAGNDAITINGGTLAVMSLANGGSVSSIGASNAAATNVTISGGSLQYIGAGSSTNRLFTIGTANATLDASGSGAVSFTNTSAIVLTANATLPQSYSLTLTGCSTGANTLTPVLSDQSGSNLTALVKSGVGEWVLAGVNTYTGGTAINGGTLALSASGTLGGGSVVLSTGTLDITGITGSSFALTSAQNLSGAGTINATGKTFVANGQLFLSGGSPSLITVSGGGFSLGSTSTSNFAVNSGSSYNQLSLSSGALTYAGALDLNFGSPLTSGTFNLFTFSSDSGDFTAVNIAGSYTGSLSDSGGNWSGTISGTTFTFTDSTGSLVLSTVPEPAVYGVVLGAAALAMSLRRRRVK